jgi:hypothetical protein
VIDSGWSDWDLEVYCDRWTIIRVGSAQEEHGSGRRLIRVRFRVLPGQYIKLAAAAGGLTGVVAAVFGTWPAAAVAASLLALCAALWLRGTRRAAALVTVLDRLAHPLQLVRCGTPDPRRRRAAVVRPAQAVGELIVVAEG